MARKKDLPSLEIPKGWPKPPFLMTDRASIAGRFFMVLERTVGGWRAIRPTLAVEVWLGDETLSDGQCSLKGGRRFFPWEHNTNAITGERRTYEQHLEGFRRMALREGGTPEAIRLLHQHHQPFTEKEVQDMAGKVAEKTAPKKSKLAKKADTAKAAKPAKAKAEKKAPAAAEADTRKITVINKENPFREGSARAEAYDLMKSSKTVQDYREAGGPTKYVNRWASEGHIKLA